MVVTTEKVSPYASMLTGAISGCLEAIVVWPTENIKTQLQLQGKMKDPKFTSFSGGVSYVVREEGALALYRGLAPILLGAVPKAGVRFGGNAYFKEKMQAANLPLHSSIVNLLAGMAAGASEAVLAATPMETVKTKTIEMKCGFGEGVKRIVAESGVGGLYKGMFATILKQSSNQGLRFFFMGFYRDWITNKGEKKITPLQSLAGGMGAGCFSTLGNNPFDVVKTKMQAVDAAGKYGSTLDCFGKVLRTEGLGGLYSGVIPRLYRVVPGQGIIFMSFDYISPLVANVLGK